MFKGFSCLAVGVAFVSIVLGCGNSKNTSEEKQSWGDWRHIIVGIGDSAELLYDEIVLRYFKGAGHPFGNHLWADNVNGEDPEVKSAIIDNGIFDVTLASVENNVPYNTPGYDDNHGTHVLGIAKMMYPSAKFYNFKAWTGDGGTFADLTKQVKNAIAADVDTINISAGGGIHTANTSVADAIADFHKQVEDASKKGILVAIASGNDGLLLDDFFSHSAKITFPLISIVGANDMGNGSNVSANFVTIEGKGNQISSLGVNKGFLSSKTGTSMATPAITGAANYIIAKLKKSGLAAEYIGDESTEMAGKGYYSNPSGAAKEKKLRLKKVRARATWRILHCTADQAHGQNQGGESQRGSINYDRIRKMADALSNIPLECKNSLFSRTLTDQTGWAKVLNIDTLCRKMREDCGSCWVDSTETHCGG